MKSLLSALALLLVGIAGAQAQEGNWLSDMQKATDTAKSGNKKILVDFTGSDWCPWCIKMDKDVLDTKDFQAYAKDNLVLMVADFPQSKQLPQATQDQNTALQKKYSVEGFPTFILIDKDGKELGRQVGYLEGGPSAFIDKLKGFK